ncbi:putative non-specific serine/threonine protein kinase [Helianthus debilis subsp. tardiflorus]
MYNISPLSSKTLFFIRPHGSMILLFSCVLFLLLSSSTTLDTLSTNQAFKDGDTIVSVDNMFELGFFSPGKSMITRSIENERVIWQSFDHPGNTLLPGMEFGKDLTTGRERVITPWKSADGPSPGEYLFWLDTNGYPQIFVRQGSVLRWRYGPWNGLKFQGRSIENPSPIYSVQFVFNEKEIYFKYEVKTPVVQRVLVLPDDTTVHLRWMDHRLSPVKKAS